MEIDMEALIEFTPIEAHNFVPPSLLGADAGEWRLERQYEEVSKAVELYKEELKKCEAARRGAEIYRMSVKCEAQALFKTYRKFAPYTFTHDAGMFFIEEVNFDIACAVSEWYSANTYSLKIIIVRMEALQRRACKIMWDAKFAAVEGL